MPTRSRPSRGGSLTPRAGLGGAARSMDVRLETRKGWDADPITASVAPASVALQPLLEPCCLGWMGPRRHRRVPGPGRHAGDASGVLGHRRIGPAGRAASRPHRQGGRPAGHGDLDRVPARHPVHVGAVAGCPAPGRGDDRLGAGQAQGAVAAVLQRRPVRAHAAGHLGRDGARPAIRTAWARTVSRLAT